MTELIRLPAPDYDIQFDLNKAIQSRRSIREYKPQAVDLKMVAQCLWAAQGVTSLGGFRTSPSAGALYPLEAYVVVGDVAGLAAGVYKYEPSSHGLRKTAEGDKRNVIGEACLEQNWMAAAPVMIVLAAVYERTTERYGERGMRYVHMEAGHAGQNVLLEAVGIGLAGVVVAAFDDTRVKKALGLPPNEHPLVLLPVGRK